MQCGCYCRELKDGDRKGDVIAYCPLHKAAPEHMQIAKLLAHKQIRWEPFGPDGTSTNGELCFNGLRYVTELDEFGVPKLNGVLRAAIRSAESVKEEVRG